MIRLRFVELLEAHGVTPYQLVKRSNGRLSLSTAYRLQQVNGAVKRFDADVLEVLCDVLNIEPSELFVREPDRRARGHKR